MSPAHSDVTLRVTAPHPHTECCHPHIECCHPHTEWNSSFSPAVICRFSSFTLIIKDVIQRYIFQQPSGKMLFCYSIKSEQNSQVYCILTGLASKSVKKTLVAAVQQFRFYVALCPQRPYRFLGMGLCNSSKVSLKDWQADISRSCLKIFPFAPTCTLPHPFSSLHLCTSETRLLWHMHVVHSWESCGLPSL